MVCTGRLLEKPTLGKLMVWNASPVKDTFRLKHSYGLANVKNRSVSEIYILPAHCTPQCTAWTPPPPPTADPASILAVEAAPSLSWRDSAPACIRADSLLWICVRTDFCPSSLSSPGLPLKKGCQSSTHAPGTELVLLWMRSSMSSVEPQNRSEVKLCQKLGCALISGAFLLSINDWDYFDLRKALMLCVAGHAYSRVACVHTAILGLSGTQQVG